MWRRSPGLGVRKNAPQHDCLTPTVGAFGRGMLDRRERIRADRRFVGLISAGDVEVARTKPTLRTPT
jgi:hypothetical protein